jgi:lipopolysaccharide transport system permease protein
MQVFQTTFREMAASFWRHRELARALIARDVVGRYRGSTMGLTWSLFNPLLLLAIYTFVFSEVFKMHWGGGIEESKADIASVIFVGLIVHGFFTECVNRAPTVILANANYVKKVIFPLEVLPWVALGSALFHATVSAAVLLLLKELIRHDVPWTAIFFPMVLLPLVLITIGCAWFLAALGVFVKDVLQVTALATTVLMFLSPVFYPLGSLAPT